MSRKNKKNKRSQRFSNPNAKINNLLRRNINYLKKRTNNYEAGIDDHRYYQPTTDRREVLIDGRGVNYKISQTPNRGKTGYYTNLTNRIAFADPRKTVVCRRRKIRRESLFAKKMVGKGVRVTKKRKMVASSKIKC